MQLRDCIEQISDDFQSTFTYVDHDTMYNMLGFPGDFEKVTEIIQKYMPDKKVHFEKTNQLGKDKEYDIYIIRLS